jgi:hypothetical protein
MQACPYTFKEADAGRWSVALYDQVIHTFSEFSDAVLMTGALNEAYRTGRDLGYNAGFDSGQRLSL